VGEATPIQFRVRVPADATAPGCARRALTELRPTLGDAVVEPATLLVSELVTNSVRHAELHRKDLIDVHIEATPRRLRVQVADSGPGFQWHGRARDDDAEGGFGMMLLKQLATSWGVEPGAPTRVWFHIDRDQRPEADHRTPGLVGGRAG